MFTADQLVAHAVGDYLLQSDWMATQKVRRWLPAAVHAALYGLPFLWLGPSPAALAVIAGTHLVIDRFRLAKWVLAATNALGSPAIAHPRRAGRGYADELPPWLLGLVLLAVDNTLHVLINGAALRWL